MNEHEAKIIWRQKNNEKMQKKKTQKVRKSAQQLENDKHFPG